jgi:hypothetical protein
MSSWYQSRNGSFQTPRRGFKDSCPAIRCVPLRDPSRDYFIPASRVYTLRSKDTSR